MSAGLRTFHDGVAIVTGAASGIGRALSESLASRGCQVILADIDVDDAEAAAARIREKGGRALARRLNVARFAEVDALVSDTIRDLGRLDYLFNNAGILVAGEVADHTIDAWNRIIAVNLGGVVNGVQAAYPRMLRQGFGHIVNTASMAGFMPSPFIASYAATKHAVVGLSKALRAEAHSRGVRVSVLCPGAVRTPILDGGKHGILLLPIPEEQARRFLRERIALFRPTEVSVFASKVLDQVAANRQIIVLPGWWRIPWWIGRLSPALDAVLARRVFARMRRMIPAAGRSEGPVEAGATSRAQ